MSRVHNLNAVSPQRAVVQRPKVVTADKDIPAAVDDGERAIIRADGLHLVGADAAEAVFHHPIPRTAVGAAQRAQNVARQVAAPAD